MADKIQTYIVRTDGEIGRTFEDLNLALRHALDNAYSDRGTHIVMPDNSSYVIVRQHPKWKLQLTKEIS